MLPQPLYKQRFLFIACLFTALSLLSGCAGFNHVTTTNTQPLQQQVAAIPDAQLLDLAVLPFDPNLSSLPSDGAISPVVRRAEAQFFPSQLAATIQKTAAWGAVRQVPSRDTITDVYVKGKILESDGETLRLQVTVSDVSNKVWYTKKYSETVGKYAYDRYRRNGQDPFQGLFNRIANDLLKQRQQLAASRAEKLRTIAALRFAKDFSPDAFSDHIKENRSGELEVTRLPAPNDPILRRIQKIRHRDNLFVDTLQGHYDNFSRRMERPYQDWRLASYDERIALAEVKRQSRIRTIAGIAAVIGGILAQNSSHASSRAAGAVAIGGGAVLVKSGISKGSEAAIHKAALKEMAQSLESEVEPQVVQLEDRTITLKGNAEAQYKQWKALLKKMYDAERGGI